MNARSGLRAALAACAATLLAASVFAAAREWRVTGGKGPVRGPLISAASGAIEIGNSHAGAAVIEARNLLPGESRRGSVTVSNPNLQPLTLSLAPRLVAGRELAESLELELRRSGRGSLYAGPLAEMPRLPLSELAPGERHDYDLKLSLPPDAKDSLQGTAGSFDLIWSARAAGPPPKCRLRALRARFFVFRRRNKIRLVSRYRAAVPARVRVVFFRRLPGGEIGGRVGALDAHFDKRPKRWGMVRVARKRPPALMRRFRETKSGYVAQLVVAGAPGYCRQFLNLDLVQLKRFWGQYAWFQRGSFRTIT